VGVAKYNPFIIFSTYMAKKILVVNRETEEKIVFRNKTVRMLETGISENLLSSQDFSKKMRLEVAEEMSILWIGTLEPHKAPILFLDAIQKVQSKIRVTIIGKGCLKNIIINRIKELGIDDKVKIIDFVKYSDIFKYYKLSDLLVFTSLRDTSGNVVLEAMSQRVPVIAFDHQGMHDILTDECAIKIPVTDYQTMVDELAKAIDTLAINPQLRTRMGKAAIQRIKEVYLWDQKARRMVEIYKEVLNENTADS
jgi:glycosyltransferase involved in cell wall biosynthesis